MAKAKKIKTEVILDEVNFLDEISTEDIPTDEGIWVGEYPTIQWNNQAIASPARHKGCWEFTLDSWGGSMVELENDLIDIQHQNEVLPGFLLPSISIAFFAWRSVWEFKEQDGQMVRAQKRDFTISEKWSKRYNFLVLLKEKRDFQPAVITAGGYTGQALFNAICQSQNRIKNILKKIGYKRPGYLFWTEMTAGRRQMVGQKDKSEIYPPLCLVPEGLRDMSNAEFVQWLSEIYIGHDGRDLFAEGLYDEGQRWTVEHNTQLALSASISSNILKGEAPEVEVLPGGAGLYFSDLSAATKEKWFECAQSIPGLFEDRLGVNKAFNGLMRRKGLGGPTNSDQWEAWRTELVRLWDLKLLEDEETNREIEMRNGG